MRKVTFMFAILGMMFLGSLNKIAAQDEKAERKDTVSVDNSDPVFYDAEEETNTKTGMGTYLAIAGGVVVLGIGGFLLLKKKKN